MKLKRERLMPGRSLSFYVRFPKSPHIQILTYFHHFLIVALLFDEGNIRKTVLYVKPLSGYSNYITGLCNSWGSVH